MEKKVSYGHEILFCYSHKADAQRVVRANRGMTLRTKTLSTRVGRKRRK